MQTHYQNLQHFTNDNGLSEATYTSATIKLPEVIPSQTIEQDHFARTGRETTLSLRRVHLTQKSTLVAPYIPCS